MKYRVFDRITKEDITDKYCWVIRPNGELSANEYGDLIGYPNAMYIIESDKPATFNNRTRRKYFRKCGICGERHEQSDMIRTEQSPNGWLCEECYYSEHPEYEIDEW